MSTWLAGVAFATALCTGIILTDLVRTHALRRSILDHPNERSLHERPTPRGGGLSISAIFVMGVAILMGTDSLPTNLGMALGGGALIVTLVGWIDDVKGLSPIARILVHALAATWAVAWIGGMETLSLGPHTLRLGPAGTAIAVAAIVWWINLFNFMDGVDGLAGSEAVFVALGGAILIGVGTAPIGPLAVVLAGASSGFLVLNWPPARIFMGDAGSGFLGFVFGTLAIASEKVGSLPALSWVLLSSVFFFDATVTLLRRIWRGEIWYAPHRTHAYQRLAALGYSHRDVTIGIGGINLMILIGLTFVSPEHTIAAGTVILATLTAIYLAVERIRPM